MNLQNECDGLRSLLNRCEELGRTEQARAAKDDRVSGWSVEQHLYHIALACDLSLSNVTSLVTEKGMLILADAETAPRTLKILQQETFERGAAESPRMVRPSETIRYDFLKREQEGNLASLDMLCTDLEVIANAPNHIPHQILGPLNASHWLRFARLHTAHHVAIVEDITAPSH